MARSTRSRIPTTYGAICRAYPQMLEWTETVADCIHKGATIGEAVDAAKMPVLAFVAPAHQQAVWDKLTQIAEAIRELHNSLPEPIPIRCPSCSSIDTAGGVCRWCRNHLPVESRIAL